VTVVSVNSERVHTVDTAVPERFQSTQSCPLPF